MKLYRQSVRLVTGLAERVGLDPGPPVEPLSEKTWAVGYAALQEIGVPVRDFEDSLGRLREMREPFNGHMEAFIDELFAPRGFWGATAVDHLSAIDYETSVDRDPSA